ncbi:MAG: serine protease [Pseudomonadota bacterium]
MTLHSAMITALAALALAGCDAVRVPELNAPGGASTTDTAEVEADTPETAEVGDGGSAGQDAPSEDPPAPVIFDLADVNAVTCGLPETAQTAPTLAQVNETAAAAAEDAPRPESLIQAQVVGASLAVASLDLFPGIVKIEPVTYDALGNEARGHCGATRIAEQWFVTAAHCIDEGYDDIRFIAGAVNVRDTEAAQIFQAEAAICHAGYDGLSTGMINDIALLKVSSDTLDTIRNVPIAAYGQPEATLAPANYATATMAGWGSTSYGSAPSPQLLSANVRLLSASPGVILVESLDGQGPCQGDSGGPLYVTENDGQQRVVGVLSNVQSPRGQTPCAGTYTGEYTNVGGYTRWIDEVIAACESSPLLCRN